jgi:hypothetical protein
MKNNWSRMNLWLRESILGDAPLLSWRLIPYAICLIFGSGLLLIYSLFLDLTRSTVKSPPAFVWGLVVGIGFMYFYRPVKSEISASLKTPHAITSIQTGDLAGRKLGGHFALYVGHSGSPIPSEISPDYPALLKKLWDKKNKVSGNKSDVRRVGNSLLEDYRAGKTPMTLDEYENQINEVVDELRKGLKWSKFSKPKVFKLAMESITAKDLLSIAATETMPEDRAGLNRSILDFMLQNAGREFLEAIPSLGDKLVSFGPYQFTHYAINHGGGVNKMNHFLPKSLRVPGDVSLLRGDDHHRAAWLFAAWNIHQLANNLSDDDFRYFVRSGQLLDYIAMAHHKPKDARSAAIEAARKRQSIYVFATPRLREYAGKTRVNRRKLEEKKDVGPMARRPLLFYLAISCVFESFCPPYKLV